MSTFDNYRTSIACAADKKSYVNIMKRFGVFLDRDGVINEEVGYLSHPNSLRLIHRAAQAIRLLNRAKIPVIVVTNQSGVARGYFSEKQLCEIHRVLSALLAKDGAHIDRYYYCPHHPVEGNSPYRVDCECRKPKSGLFFKAVEELDIDLRRSYFIGDKETDIEAGWRVECKTILVLTGHGQKTWINWSVPFRPYHVARNLEEAVMWILRREMNSYHASRKIYRLSAKRRKQ